MPVEPVQVHLEVKDLDGLFDRVDDQPKYPHTGRQLDEDLADYLESRVREKRAAPSVDLEILVQSGTPTPDQQRTVEDQIRTYFSCEKGLAELDARVNRVEGIGQFRRALPMLLGAGVVALLVYIAATVAPPQSILLAFVIAFVYLVFITVVWVLLWDPFEKVVFDGYMVDVRVAALDKLSHASIRFVGSPVPPKPAEVASPAPP